MKKTAILMTTLTAASAHAAPVFNIFELGIKDGQSAAYNHIGDENIRTSLEKEPGTLAMYSVKQKDNPQMAYMIEIYDDDAAYQSHRDSPHFQKYLKETAELLQDKTFTEITPTLLQNQGGLEYTTP